MEHASTTDLPVPPEISPEHTLHATEWGMLGFLLSEVAFFGTLIVTYISFMGQDISGPTPASALSMPLVIVSTLCLLSSSLVIHFAEGAFKRGQVPSFCVLWGVTIALGVAFLTLTGFEWHDLIFKKQLTISRNLFGTTYFTLVGFHGVHVTVGVLVMAVVLGLAWRGPLRAEQDRGVRMVTWYWHFVDVVWIFVFLVVYVVSRSGA